MGTDLMMNDKKCSVVTALNIDNPEWTEIDNLEEVNRG
jgi:hypothetical protein